MSTPGYLMDPEKLDPLENSDCSQPVLPTVLCDFQTLIGEHFSFSRCSPSPELFFLAIFLLVDPYFTKE